MTDDVAKLCVELGKVWTKLVVWPVLLVYYAVRSGLVSGALAPVRRPGPGPARPTVPWSTDAARVCVQLAALMYFVLGTAVSRLLAGGLVPLYYRQERAEGHLRFLHVHVRTHAEAIALLRGAAAEAQRLAAALARVLANWRRIVRARVPVDAATQFFSYFGSVLSYAVVAVPVFVGRGDVAALPPAELAAHISEAAFLNMYLLALLTEALALATDVAALAGYTYRIDELLQALLDLPTPPPAPDAVVPTEPAAVAGGPPQAPLLVITDTTVAAPDGTVLVAQLTLALVPGMSLAITGPSGAGKTSLVRVLRGLWAPTSGTATWRDDVAPRVLFLPQEPYLCAGTLADQLRYPHVDAPPLERMPHQHKAALSVPYTDAASLCGPSPACVRVA
jgi:ATP-binding cassette, subfamily D (ALD), member 4